MNDQPLVLIDGESPTVDDLLSPALSHFAHFSAMQVRDGAVRGLANHLRRLREAHAELFGTQVDDTEIRRHLLRASERQSDSYLTIVLFEPEPGRVRVMVILRPPIDPTSEPVVLKSVRYVRPFAHIKHVGWFPQAVHANNARRDGFDDILLVTPEGQVAECSIANIGFFDDSGVVWPNAPALYGITWQLLDEHLALAGIENRRAEVMIETMPSFSTAFTTNSIGVVPVRSIDDHVFEGDTDLVDHINRAYAAAPWDVI